MKFEDRNPLTQIPNQSAAPVVRKYTVGMGARSTGGGRLPL